MKSNFERLSVNQKETKELIAKHISETLDTPPPSGEVIEELSNKAKEAILSLSYKDAIESLEQLRDAKQGISWHVFEHSDGTKDLIRDASKADSTPPPLNSPESFAIVFLNNAIAAEKLLDTELLQAKGNTVAEGRVALAKKEIRKQVARILEEVTQDDFSIKEKNTLLINTLTEAGIDKPKAKLEVTKEFGNLSYPQYHVTTITKQKDSEGKDRLVIESDTMLLGLTDVQKAQYLAISQAPIGANVELIYGKAEIDMSWYNNLPFHTKELIRENASEIAKGNKILPTQLRFELIGLRNAYSKSTFVTPPLESTDMLLGENALKMISQTLHSGTASFHGKSISEKQRQEIADENLKQLETFIESGKKATINVLNSPVNPTGIDSEIHEQIGIGQAKINGGRATTPLNAFRLISRNDNSGFEKALQEVAKATEKDFPEITRFLRTGSREKQARKELKAAFENAPDKKELLQTLEHAINAKRFMNSFNILIDPDNTNLKLSSAMKLVSFSAQHGALKEYAAENKVKLNVDVILTSCASGKDRTGLTETDTTRVAINDALGLKSDEKQAIENLKTQVKGGHTQELASFNGGTRGAHGIKADSLSAFPEDPYKNHITGLHQNTASYNKLKVEKPTFLEKLANLLTSLVQSIGLIDKPRKVEPLIPNKKGRETEVHKVELKKQDLDLYLKPESSKEMAANKTINSEKELEKAANKWVSAFSKRESNTPLVGR